MTHRLLQHRFLDTDRRVSDHLIKASSIKQSKRNRKSPSGLGVNPALQNGPAETRGTTLAKDARDFSYFAGVGDPDVDLDRLFVRAGRGLNEK